MNILKCKYWKQSSPFSISQTNLLFCVSYWVSARWYIYESCDVFIFIILVNSITSICDLETQPNLPLYSVLLPLLLSKLDKGL